jgi:pyruvate kinase
MNLPGCIVDLPTVTEKDEDDIVNFGLKHGIDMIALSFARKRKKITKNNQKITLNTKNNKK